MGGGRERGEIQPTACVAAFSRLALDDGSVLGFGENGQGQAAAPDLGGRRAIQVAAGGSHSLALLDDGSVLGFGDNGRGQAAAPDLGGRRAVMPQLPWLPRAVVRAILLAGHHGDLRGVANANLLLPVVRYLSLRQRQLGP